MGFLNHFTYPDYVHKRKEVRMKRKTVLFVILSTFLIFSGGEIYGQDMDGSEDQAAAAWGGRPIRVMTRNLYVGTDVDTVMGFLMTNPTIPEVMEMVALAYNMLLYTDFPTRAKALADEIVCTCPDLIGLQEVFEVRKQTPGDWMQGDPDLMDLQFDYLEILLKELKNERKAV